MREYERKSDGIRMEVMIRYVPAFSRLEAPGTAALPLSTVYTPFRYS